MLDAGVYVFVVEDVVLVATTVHETGERLVVLYQV